MTAGKPAYKGPSFRICLIGVSVVLVTLGSGLAAGSVGASPGDTDEPPTVAEISEAANAADSSVGNTQEVTTGGVIGERGAPSVEIPVDPDEGVSVASGAGPEITLGLPDTSLADGVSIGGNLVYRHGGNESAVVARPTATGVQALIVLNGPEAPSRFAFRVNLDGKPAVLQLGTRGTVRVSASGAADIGVTILPAWASDANGLPVRTHYEVRSNQLIQVVEHGGSTSYPVVADPSVSLGRYIYVRYTKADVRRIARNPVTNKLKYSAAICAAIPHPVAAAACGFYIYDVYASVANTFEYADRHKRCVEMKYGLYSHLLRYWKSYKC